MEIGQEFGGRLPHEVREEDTYTLDFLHEIIRIKRAKEKKDRDMAERRARG